jgi:hypothetical protein
VNVDDAELMAPSDRDLLTRSLQSNMRPLSPRQKAAILAGVAGPIGNKFLATGVTSSSSREIRLGAPIKVGPWMIGELSLWLTPSSSFARPRWSYSSTANGHTRPQGVCFELPSFA